MSDFLFSAFLCIFPAIPMQRSKPVYTSPPFRQQFNEQVWDIVAAIPRGRVMTYGQIAALIARPDGVRKRFYMAARARWVGSAMASCPGKLPWHRVINAQGKISVRDGNDHHLLQRRRLEAEGVQFDSKGRIDLDRFCHVPQHR